MIGASNSLLTTKGSNMWCHYCDKNNHNKDDCRAIAKFKQQKKNKADCRAIAKFKQQKKDKARFEAKAGPGKKSLAFFFEEN
jgi:hypothetical protein